MKNWKTVEQSVVTDGHLNTGIPSMTGNKWNFFAFMRKLWREALNFAYVLHLEQVSNKFYFTFTIRSEAMQNGSRIRNVVPATEEEARRVIERMDAESL